MTPRRPGSSQTGPGIPETELQPSRDGSDPPTESRAFGRYLLAEELGRGGMGVVWRAHDTVLKRDVALKMVSRGPADAPQALERFLREAKAAARLAHAAIVSVHDAGEIDGQFYFTCQLVRGESLDRALGAPMPPERAAAVVRGIAEALDYAHARGIVHRDIKPANVIVDDEGRPHVLDFGVAKDLRAAPGASPTLEGSILGTPRYMSPEQAAGRVSEVGPASDQFSLGAVLYELLTGRPAFGGGTLRDELNSVCERAPTPPALARPGVPRALERICLRMIEKDPARRYPSLGAVADDLGRFLDDRGGSAPPSYRRHDIRGANVAPAAPLADGAPSAARQSRVGERRRTSRSMRQIRRRSARNTWILLGIGVVAIVSGVIGVALSGGGRPTSAADSPAPSALPANEKSDPADETGSLRQECRQRVLELERAVYGGAAAGARIAEKVEAAVRPLEKLAAARPDLAEAPANLGRVWELGGRLDRAVESWRRALVLDPDAPGVLYSLGRARLERAYIDTLVYSLKGTFGDLADWKARSRQGALDLERALAGDSAFPQDALERAVGTAWLAFVRGDPGENAWELARRLAAELFAGRPGVEDLHLVLAASAPSLELAAASCDRAIAQRPFHPMAYLFRATVRCRAGSQRGMEDCSAALELVEEFAQAHTLKAMIVESLGDPALALAAFDRAIEIGEGPAELYNKRAVLRHKTGDRQGALADMERAIELAPELSALHANRGVLLREMGNPLRAVGDFDRALELDPSNREALRERGIAHHNAGNLDLALADLDRVLGLDPDDPEARNARGSLYKSRGDVALALADFDRALESNPDMLEALANRGDARIMAGNYDGAIVDLERALQVAPPGWSYRALIQDVLARARSARGGG